MNTRLLHRYRRALSDPATRPSALNLGVALAYLLVAALAALLGAFAGDVAGLTGDGAWLRSMYAFVLALFYLGGSYTYHWHAKYTFERASRSFALGTLGAALGLCGLLVQFAFPMAGTMLSLVGVGSNVLGGSWGTFVYTYNTYAPD
ncbi:hypothetical protein [Halobacterium zhouii]|uniref:hypothetical protein n=1 Tax=Halobacterium zhouii TaxID=2902624 RepID=UPI001E577B94|nr:hypothetical protein [Halobacterium zhouii]